MAAEKTTSLFVTGGAGFLGNWILVMVHEAHPDWTLVSFDKTAPLKPLDYVTYLQGDITSPRDVGRALAWASTSWATTRVLVVHTAGIVPPLKYRYGRQVEKPVYATNLKGTQVVLDAARGAGAAGFVFTSSCCAVIDNLRYAYANIDESWPTSATRSTVYGESKARAERLVLAANDAESFPCCILRPSVLFGPGDYQLVPSIHACIAKGEMPFIVGAGTNLWDVTDVRNVAQAHLLAAENLLQPPGGLSAAGEIFFIQNNEPIPFRDFCKEIWKNFGAHPTFEVHIPKALAHNLATVGDWVAWLLARPVTLSRGSVGDACAVRYASGDKAQRILGFVPKIGIEQGIRDTCEVGGNRVVRGGLHCIEALCLTARDPL